LVKVALIANTCKIFASASRASSTRVANSANFHYILLEKALPSQRVDRRVVLQRVPMDQVFLGLFSLSRDQIVEHSRVSFQGESLAFTHHCLFLAIGGSFGNSGLALVTPVEDSHIHGLFIHACDVRSAQGKRLHVAEVHLLLHVGNIRDLLVVKDILLVRLLGLRLVLVGLLLGLLYSLHLFVSITLLYIPQDVVLTCGMDVQIAETLLKQASELSSSKCPSSEFDQVLDFLVFHIEISTCKLLLQVSLLIDCLHVVRVEKDA